MTTGSHIASIRNRLLSLLLLVVLLFDWRRHCFFDPAVIILLILAPNQDGFVDSMVIARITQQSIFHSVKQFAFSKDFGYRYDTHCHVIRDILQSTFVKQLYKRSKVAHLFLKILVTCHICVCFFGKFIFCKQSLEFVYKKCTISSYLSYSTLPHAKHLNME